MNIKFNEAVNFAEERLLGMIEVNLISKAEIKGRFLEHNINPEEIDWFSLIEDSKENSDAFEKLRLYCSWVIRRDNYLEAPLRLWLCDYLEGLIKEPPGNKGRPKKSFGSEYFIALLISIVCRKYKLTHSRNQASPELSGCDVIAEAIREVNSDSQPEIFIKPTSYNELRQLFSRMKKKFPNQFSLTEKS